MDKRYVKPKGFEDFTVVETCMNRPDVVRVYDIENKIIWININAAEDANIVGLEPRR